MRAGGAAEQLGGSSISLPADSYIYSVIPVSGSDTFAAISSDDSLRIFDPTNLNLISSITPGKVHESVTCLENLDANASTLVTAGRDAALRMWDLRKTGFPSIDFAHGPDAPYLALASKGHKVAVGTELTQSQATIAVWDYRSPKEPFAQYVEAHNDDVTELRFHQTNPSLLLSGSTDGLINLLDTTILDEDETLLQIINHGSSIHHAGFLSEAKLYALSHDEIFSIYPLDSSDDAACGAPPVAFGDLRPQLNCDYAVDVVLTRENTALLAAGSHRQQHLDLVPLDFASECILDSDRAVRLPGAHGQDIVRSVCFDHSEQTIFTGGEDGLIRAWRVPSENAMTSSAIRPKKAKTDKHERTSESRRARFNPY